MRLKQRRGIARCEPDPELSNIMFYFGACCRAFGFHDSVRLWRDSAEVSTATYQNTTDKCIAPPFEIPRLLRRMAREEPAHRSSRRH